MIDPCIVDADVIINSASLQRFTSKDERSRGQASLCLSLARCLTVTGVHLMSAVPLDVPANERQLSESQELEF